MVWHDSPYDEYPVADVRKGEDKFRQALRRLAAGFGDETVFLLTWDDGEASMTTSSPRTSNTPPTVSSWPTVRGRPRSSMCEYRARRPLEPEHHQHPIDDIGRCAKTARRLWLVNGVSWGSSLALAYAQMTCNGSVTSC